jgi:hypothetical protein
MIEEASSRVLREAGHQRSEEPLPRYNPVPRGGAPNARGGRGNGRDGARNRFGGAQEQSMFSQDFADECAFTACISDNTFVDEFVLPVDFDYSASPERQSVAIADEIQRRRGAACEDGERSEDQSNEPYEPAVSLSAPPDCSTSEYVGGAAPAAADSSYTGSAPVAPAPDEESRFRSAVLVSDEAGTWEDSIIRDLIANGLPAVEAYESAMSSESNFEVKAEFLQRLSAYIDDIDRMLGMLEGDINPDVLAKLIAAKIALRTEYETVSAIFSIGMEAYMALSSVRGANAIRNVLRDRQLYLDSCCTAHLFNSSMLPGTTNQRTVDPPRVFRGIGGTIEADVLADGEYFKDIYFSDDATENLLSFAQLANDGHIITFDSDDSSFLVSKDNVVHRFSQNERKCFPLVQSTNIFGADSDIMPKSLGNHMRYKTLPRDASVPNAQPPHVITVYDLPIPRVLIDVRDPMSLSTLFPNLDLDHPIRGEDRYHACT